ncbi:MAG: MMPL family transporter [Flavobacteriaceae bacterium]|nr:MMPL family transporter [Flavobacteriaceae bacterium]
MKIYKAIHKHNFSKDIISFCLRFRYALIGLILVLTGIFLNNLLDIEPNNEFEHWFNKQDIEYKNYSDYVSSFGNDQYFILVYRSDSLLSESGLKKVRSISDSIIELEGVLDLVSLSTIKAPVKSPFGILFTRLIPRERINPETVETRLNRHDKIFNNIVSDDRKATVFHIYQTPEVHPDSLYTGLNNIIRSTGEVDNFHYYSGKVLSIEATKLAKSQSGAFLAISLFIIFFILILLFRNVIFATIPLITSVVSIIITLGVFTANGGNIDMLSGIIPLVILVTSSTFSIHFLSKIRHFSSSNAAGPQVLESSLNAVFIPGLISNITTSLALLSFTFSSIAPIRVFGMYCALGISISFVVSCIVIIILFHSVSKWFLSGLKKSRFTIDMWILLFMRSKVIQGPYTIIIASIVTIVSIYGISLLTAETDVFRFFKPEHKVVADKEIVESWFTGTQPLEVIISTKGIETDSLPEFINKIGNFEKQLEEGPMIEYCLSIFDFYHEFGIDQLPGNNFSRMINSSDQLKRFYSEENQQLRLIVNTNFTSNQESQALAEEIKIKINSFFQNNRPEYFITGVSLLYAGLNSSILESQMLSIGFSFFIISFIIVFIFGTNKVAFTGILPNVLPVINTLGIMGLIGIPLDVGTVLVASISLGVSVDDTIYLLHAYRGKGNITLGLKHVASALIRTTIVICLGFLIMVFSNYQPIYYLGIFVAVNILMALVYDLVLLPWILIRIKKKN